jgi:hypothetical protein
VTYGIFVDVLLKYNANKTKQNGEGATFDYRISCFET